MVFEVLLISEFSTEDGKERCPWRREMLVCYFRDELFLRSQMEKHQFYRGTCSSLETSFICFANYEELIMAAWSTLWKIIERVSSYPARKDGHQGLSMRGDAGCVWTISRVVGSERAEYCVSRCYSLCSLCPTLKLLNQKFPVGCFKNELLYS